MENKDLQSSENMDFSGIFATNRNILKSVCRLLKKSKSTLFQKKTQKKYMKRTRASDENKAESPECTRVEVNNLETDSEDTSSLQNEWLIHLVLGNLPRDGGLRLVETDTPNAAEKDDHTEVSSPKQDVNRKLPQLQSTPSNRSSFTSKRRRRNWLSRHLNCPQNLDSKKSTFCENL